MFHRARKFPELSGQQTSHVTRLRASGMKMASAPRIDSEKLRLRGIANRSRTSSRHVVRIRWAHATNRPLDHRSNSPPPIGVCYLSSIIANDHAGTEGHLIRLARRLDRSAFDPLIRSLQRTPFVDAWRDTDVSLESVGYQSMLRPEDWVRLWQFGQRLRGRCHVLECHSPEAQFVGSLVARWARIPVLIGCRRSLGYNFDRKARTQLRWSNRRVDCFLANSRSVIAHRQQQEGLQADQFELIHNGVDIDQFAEDAKKPVCESYSALSEDTVRIVMAANLRPVKNHRLLLNAFELVVRELDNVKLILLGSGEEESRLKQQAHRLGLGGHVMFLGAHVPIAPYLCRASIGCLSSDSEGFSNAILEYMAAGLPVVATDVGGAREAVIQDKTGFLVPANDASSLAASLLDLARNASLRRELGSQGRQRIEQKFTLDQQVSRYESLYRQLVSRGGPEHPDSSAMG